VLIVDDDALVRAGLTMFLAGADDIEIVGEAPDGSEVEHAVAEHQPDVVLMDIRMPGMDGLAATEILRGRDHPPDVIILTTFHADILPNPAEPAARQDTELAVLCPSPAANSPAPTSA
jgi:DNA-binding NarL/FixJ family response regulator